MKAVIVDGHTLNPGDLKWDAMKEIADCQIYDRTTLEETIERCKDAKIVITNKVIFDQNILASLPKLKFIGITATGYNVIDLQAAKNRGVTVSNVPAYSTMSVAQMTFALLLELCQHVGHHANTVKEGKWAACDDFCYWDRPLTELAGLTMGLVGFGRIGKATAALAEAFGMDVIVYKPNRDQENHPTTVFVELDELFAQSDVLSLHCPLTETNKEMVNANRLAMMKPTAFVINTSRGPLINEQDLANALNSGQIAGAGLDVLSIEPAASDNPLLTAKNCVITPHIAWATRAARERLMAATVANVKAFIAGDPINMIS